MTDDLTEYSSLFEKEYGSIEFLKAIISVVDQLLVDKDITTTGELKLRLQKELVTRVTKGISKKQQTGTLKIVICPNCGNPIGSMATCTVCLAHKEKNVPLSQPTICGLCGKITRPGKPPATGEHCLQCGGALKGNSWRIGA